MSQYPHTVSGDEISSAMRELIDRLMSLLLEGTHPSLAVLRAQHGASRLRSVEFTGHGFFAAFEVPDQVPRVEPASFTGGNVAMRMSWLETGAGCLLFIREGRLDTLEGYTYGDEAWPAEPVIESIDAVQPVLISNSVA